MDSENKKSIVIQWYESIKRKLVYRKAPDTNVNMEEVSIEPGSVMIEVTKYPLDREAIKTDEGIILVEEGILEHIEIKEGVTKEDINTIDNDRIRVGESKNKLFTLRWIAQPVGYICSKDQREEWFGDLYEVVHEMQTKKYPRWMINLICLGKVIVLLVSIFEIKLDNLIAVFKAIL